jgi:hypothetical protein
VHYHFATQPQGRRILEANLARSSALKLQKMYFFPFPAITNRRILQAHLRK